MELKPYPSYRNTDLPWLAQIPAHWDVKRLKWTIEYCQNGVWGDEPNDIDDIACVRVADFDRTKFRVNFPVPTLRALPKAERRNKSLRKGDLLLEKSGGGDLQPVVFIVLYDSDEPAICSNFVARMPVRENYDPNFLCYLHASLYAGKINTQSIKQNTGIQNLDSASYLNEKIALPPLPEQQATAAYLDRQTAKIDALIAKKERLINLLAEQRSALIDHATTKGLNLNIKMKDSGLQWLGKIPEHWEIIRSKRLFGLRNVKAPASDKQLTVSQEFGVISQEEYMAKGSRVVQVIIGADILKHVEPNDFIISMRSFQGGIEWSKIGGSTSSAYVVLVPNEQVHCPYFSYLLKSNQYIQALQSTSNLIRDGQALRYSNFCIVNLPVVPLSEQKAIAEYLDNKIARIDALVEKVYQAIECLREYRAALISSVVTGKINVYKT